MEGTKRDQRFAEEFERAKLNTGFTKEILTLNPNKYVDKEYFKKIPAIKRKILYILDNIENNEITARDRIEYLKEKSGVTDEKFIKEIMGNDREKYFGTLEIKEITNKKIVEVLGYPEALKHPNKTKEQIAKEREERKEARRARKKRGQRKGVQTKIDWGKEN